MSTIETLEPGLRRVLAPNPSPMTAAGTNSYLLGESALAVIDPGPDDPHHLDTILEAAGGAVVSHILVTHAHRDHSSLAPRLAKRTGAPVLAYGDARAGRSPAMAALGALGGLGGGEGVDHGFAPDVAIRDGERVRGSGWEIAALWTPGHFGNHTSFLWNDAAFTGDLVMGRASSLVSPPDGDLSDFLSSCERLRARPLRRLYPGHGAPVEAPARRIDWLIAHRRSREAQILDCLAQGPSDAEGLARRIYAGSPPALMPAATRNVLAHLVGLRRRAVVETRGAPAASSRFCLREVH